MPHELEAENNTINTEITARDFVHINFLSKPTKEHIKYVARVQKVMDNGEFLVNYLKQYKNRRNEFAFPNAVLEEIISNDSHRLQFIQDTTFSNTMYCKLFTPRILFSRVCF